MADSIGIELDSDTLVLTRGRDFKWKFENLDAGGNPVDYPAGDLFFALDTGGQHNAIQQVEVAAANGGFYKLSHEGSPTAAIGYYDFASNPLSLAEDVQAALEALPSIGAGNVYVHPAQLVPSWEIKLTLGTGHNEVQLISFSSIPASGTWKIGLGTATSNLIPFNASSALVQSEIAALAGVGNGNVKVTGDMASGFRVEFIGALANTNVGQLVGYTQGIDLGAVGWFFGIFGPIIQGALAPPASTVKVVTLVQGNAKFNQPLVDSVVQAITALFGSYGILSGVTVELGVVDNLHATIKVTSLKGFDESAQITFGLDVTPTAVGGALNNTAALAGVFDAITVTALWNHLYQVEFVGELANTVQAPLGADAAALTGPNGEQAVNVSVIKPGKARHTKWSFTIEGSVADLKTESEEADQIQPRTLWQLVWLPEGEARGGDPLGLGRVVVQQ